MVTAERRAGARIGVALAATSVVVHLAALYWPRVAVPADVPYLDKLGHLLLFAVPAYLVCRLAQRHQWAVLAAFAIHAPVSEVLQPMLLPGRFGDVWDAVADLAGLALAAAALVVRARPRR